MITPDQHKRLKELDEFVMNYQRAGKTYGQFWDEFWVQAAALEAEAEVAGHESELAIALYEIVDGAHEGFGGPPEMMGKMMEG